MKRPRTNVDTTRSAIFIIRYRLLLSSDRTAEIYVIGVMV